MRHCTVLFKSLLKQTNDYSMIKVWLKYHNMVTQFCKDQSKITCREKQNGQNNWIGNEIMRLKYYVCICLSCTNCLIWHTSTSPPPPPHCSQCRGWCWSGPVQVAEGLWIDIKIWTNESVTGGPIQGIKRRDGPGRTWGPFRGGRTWWSILDAAFPASARRIFFFPLVSFFFHRGGWTQEWWLFCLDCTERVLRVCVLRSYERDGGKE